MYCRKLERGVQCLFQAFSVLSTDAVPFIKIVTFFVLAGNADIKQVS